MANNKYIKYTATGEDLTTVLYYYNEMVKAAEKTGVNVKDMIYSIINKTPYDYKGVVDLMFYKECIELVNKYFTVEEFEVEEADTNENS